jgi:hypothetical protein
VVDDGLAVHIIPEEFVQPAQFKHQFCIVDGGGNFQPVSDDAGVLQ